MTARDWVLGARLKTQPATLVPIAAGTALAASLGTVSPARVLLTLLFAEGFVIGTNYLNDYSDGIRGTDAERIGPVRLVGSGRVSPRQVLIAGLACYGVSAVAGIVLGVTGSPWLLALIPLCALGGWYYTGGRRPYGYRAGGELGIFVFHGIVAVCGTVYIQLGRIPLLALAAAVPIGLVICALLETNNLRDIRTDKAAGKITIAVLIGDRRTRALYALILIATFASALALTPARPWVALVPASAPFAIAPLRRVLGGSRGAELVPALEQTCVFMLVFGALFSAGLAL